MVSLWYARCQKDLLVTSPVIREEYNEDIQQQNMCYVQNATQMVEHSDLYLLQESIVLPAFLCAEAST